MRTNSLTKNRVAEAVLDGRGTSDVVARAPRAKRTAAGPSTSEVRISLDSIELHEMTVRLVGTAPLVVHRFGKKAAGDIADNVGLGGALRKPSEKKKREPKNAVADFLDTLYVPGIDDAVEAYHEPSGKTIEWYDPRILNEGLHPVWARFVGPAAKRGARFVFPANAIREAIGSAAFRNGVTDNIVGVRSAIRVARIMLPIETPHPPQMHYMIAVVGNRKPDLRFRALFGGPDMDHPEWAVTSVLRYFTNTINDETVLNLLNVAGTLVGIGEMRGEKKIGSYGFFQIDRESVRIEKIRL